MTNHSLLFATLAFLGAAVVAVPLFRRLKLPAVLGYLVAGAAVGPWGLRVVEDVSSTMSFAELGVVMLLFVIGLELEPKRLWTMRSRVFGLGGAQVLLTSVLFFGAGLALGASPVVAGVVAVSLSFSSTAFALQFLSEKQQLATGFGRAAFGVLLFQDLAAIPLIAVIPLLAREGAESAPSLWLMLGKAAAAVVGLALAGRFLMRPAFRAMALSRTNEIFTAAALLLVLGVALFMESIGLSMALGSFLAGVLLSDSEFRHELEADIEPFKGLLLGLFFMAVGMGIDFGLARDRPLAILGLVAGILVSKAVILFGLSRASGLGKDTALRLAAIIPQGGEFAFVVFAAASAAKLLAPDQAGLLVLAVTISIAATPFLVLLDEWRLSASLKNRKAEYDEIEDDTRQVIIAGFGRVGQIVGRSLRVMRVPFTALEADASQVEVLRKFGSKVYFGDASRLELLRSAGAEKAKLFVLAIDDVPSSIKTATIVRQNFPGLTILARARNRQHVFALLDLGVQKIWRETLASGIEMAEAALTEIGLDESEARRTMERFREHDEDMLLKQHAVHKDESKVIDVSKQAAQTLTELLQRDREDEASRQPLE